ncbi:type II secretion system protein [Sutcliffiella horikoshii]
MSRKKKGIFTLIGLIVVISILIYFENREDHNQLINTHLTF